MSNQVYIVESRIDKFYAGSEGCPQSSNVQIDGPAPAQAPLDGNCYRKRETPKILIISNDAWEEKPLHGYKKDAKNLEDMWEEFGCDVTLHENATCKQMRKYIDNFARCILNGEETFCAVIILSHGGCEKDLGEYVLGVDDGTEGYIAVDDIFRSFSNITNQKLGGMPKIFIFQCCRGRNKPQGVSTGSAAAGPSDDSLPHVSDTLVMYATQPKDVAIVDEEGSWLIKAVLEVFRENYTIEHVADMLTMVNRIVAEKTVRMSKDKELIGVKCMSEIRSTLRYKLRIV